MRGRCSSAPARAIRLLHAIIGDDAYHSENARKQDAAKPLSRARDAKVILEPVNDLASARSIGKLVKRAESIASDLGTDHDLAGPGDRIVTVSPAPSPEREALFAAIAHRRFDLATRR